jgi:hypothetical protein
VAETLVAVANESGREFFECLGFGYTAIFNFSERLREYAKPMALKAKIIMIHVEISGTGGTPRSIFARSPVITPLWMS